HLISIGITEYEPRVVFIGHSAQGFERKPEPSQDAFCAIENCAVAVGPASPMAMKIGEAYDALAHLVPPAATAYSPNSACLTAPLSGDGGAAAGRTYRPTLLVHYSADT